MEGPRLVCGRREASLRLPHASLLRRTREAGGLVHKTALDHSEGWERDSTSAAGWTGTSERSDGGVCGRGHDGP